MKFHNYTNEKIEREACFVDQLPASNEQIDTRKN